MTERQTDKTMYWFWLDLHVGILTKKFQQSVFNISRENHISNIALRTDWRTDRLELFSSFATENTVNVSKKFKDYRTLYTVYAKVEPAKGNEFCRASTLCPMKIEVGLYWYPKFILVPKVYTGTQSLYCYPKFYTGTQSLYWYPKFILVPKVYTGTQSLFWYPKSTMVPKVYTGTQSLYW